MSGGQRTQALIAQVEALVTQIDSIVEILNDHDHERAYVAPDLAAAPTLNPGGIWTYGAKVELLASGFVSDIFDIHWAHVVASANDQYQVALYEGLAGFENIITEFPFERANVQNASTEIAIITPRQPAGTRISAALASASGAGSMTIKIGYHMY